MCTNSYIYYAVHAAPPDMLERREQFVVEEDVYRDVKNEKSRKVKRETAVVVFMTSAPHVL